MVKLERIIVLCVLLMPFAAMGQNISVTSAQNQNIATFVQNNLIGQGVYVWNVKYNNATGNITKPQIGTFNSNGYMMLQMDSGVVMTTGNVSVAPGPNNSNSQTASVTGYYTDATLSTYATNTLYGCSTVDFDFVSISPFVTMNYCFASEEYPEYVCANVNDIFAFLVTGPDGVTKNIAIIPHTVTASTPNGIAVAINSVNQGMAGGNGGSGTGCYYSYSDFYVANHNPGASGQPSGSQGVEYDGFTQKLSANATLIPCETYHMHISICNVGDNAFDSGVFIEKGSFNSPSADVSLSHRYADTIERSSYTVLPLTLAGSSYTNGNVMVQFGGDAEVGLDYTVVTDSGATIDATHPTFNVSQANNSLTFHGTMAADLTEPKLIELYLMTSLCQAHPSLKTYDTIRYVMVEDDVVRLRHDTIVAYDTCKQVGVEVVIGQPPFSFHWMPEDDIDFPYQQYSTANITQSRTYQVAVADTRGHTDTTDIFVEVRQSTPEGIDETRPEASVEVYPNPTDGEMNIVADGITQVEVFDALGRRVYHSEPVSQQTTLIISPLPAGLYTVRVTTNVGIKTEKVLVR